MDQTKEREAFDFEVAREPIFVQGREVKGKKAIVRADNGAPVLGIVSGKYEVIKHRDVIEGFREALKGDNFGSFNERISLTKNGAHLFATYRFEDQRVEVKKGDFTSFQFIVKNSYDGTNTLQISLGAYRLVCSNGMVIGNRFFGYSQRHIGTKVGVDVSVLKESIGELAETFKGTLPTMQKMVETHFSETATFRGEAFEPEHTKLPEYLCKEAYDQFVVGQDGSVWGYLNAYTHAITHSMKRNSPQTQIEYGRKAWALALEKLEV